MTNDEATKWLTKHSVVAIFHKDRIVLVLPSKQLDVTAYKDSPFKLEIKGGFTLACSDPGDELHHVVECARHAWVERLSPFDVVGEATGSHVPPVRLDFRSNF